MEFETVLIKTEPEDEILDSSNVFHSHPLQNSVKSQDNSQVEYLPTNSNNGNINKSTSFNCKSEPVDSFNEEKTVLNDLKMKINDIFNEDDLVDVSKLKQLLNLNKTIPECSNIKHEKEYEANSDHHSPIYKELNIKKEEEESDIAKDPLRLPESNDITLKDVQKVQEFSENTNADVKMEISECALVKTDNYKTQRTHALKQSRDNRPLKQQVKRIRSKNHKCNICSYKTSKKIDLMRHIDSIHNEHRTKIKCEFCEKSFARKQKLDNHLLKQHKQETECKIHQCNSCSYQTTLKYYLTRHIRTTHEHRIKRTCQFCYKTFVTEQSHDDHVMKRHKGKISLTENKFLQCNMCPYQTIIKSYLDKHVNTVHNEQRSKVSCQFCDKSFLFKYSLDDHLLKQHKEKLSEMKDLITSKIHTCNFCDLQTTSLTFLNVHINSNHRQKNQQKTRINCQFCDKSFTGKPALENHLLKQHKKLLGNDLGTVITSKIHKCKDCAFETTFKSTLTRHKCSVLVQD